MSRSRTTARLIWVQTLRTGNRIQVSSKPGINGAPAFSPDGRQARADTGRASTAISTSMCSTCRPEGDAAPDDAPRHRYGGQLVPGWPLYLFHVGPQRRPADLPGTGGGRHRPNALPSKGGYNARPSACRPTASAWPWSTWISGELPNRGDGRRQHREVLVVSAGQSGRVAELRAQ